MEKHNAMTVFNNGEFGEVRTVLRDGEPWFVAADVCRALGIENSRDAVSRLDEDEKGVAIADTLGGKQEMQVVSEPGMYSLIFASRKPEAKAFKRWVTHEVLPQIRKKGFYSALVGDELIAFLTEHREKNMHYLEEPLREINFRLRQKKWFQMRELWERRHEYTMFELDWKIAEIWAGDVEFYQKASAHFWKHNFKVKIGAREDCWKDPSEQLMRQRAAGVIGGKIVDKAKEEADEYWNMCHMHGNIDGFKGDGYIPKRIDYPKYKNALDNDEHYSLNDDLYGWTYYCLCEQADKKLALTGV